MSRYGPVVAVLLMFLAASGSAAAQAVLPNDGPVIVAQGEAIVMKAPDRAWVQIGAEGRASKPAEAQRLAADAMTSVQAALKQLGFGSDVLRTSGYTLQPEYDYANGRQTFRDYLARHQVEIRIDDLKRLPEVLDASGSSGAASVTSLRFDLRDKTTSEAEALRLAVKDATTRAEAIAAGAGKALGAIVRLQEQRSTTPAPVWNLEGGNIGYVGGGGRGSATPIEAGQVQVTARVTLTVAIKEPAASLVTPAAPLKRPLQF
jgi:uncharacterized protein YggE